MSEQVSNTKSTNNANKKQTWTQPKVHDLSTPKTASQGLFGGDGGSTGTSASS